MSHGAVLAKSGEAVKAGPIGLAVVLLLCIACYFLFKSMSKHMREVRENFPTAEAPPAVPSVVPADVRRAEIIRTGPEGGRAVLPPVDRGDGNGDGDGDDRVDGDDQRLGTPPSA